MKLLNWLNGWRRDMDGWLVRARRAGDPAALPAGIGFVEESAIAVRTHEHACSLDAGRSALEAQDES